MNEEKALKKIDNIVADYYASCKKGRYANLSIGPLMKAVDVVKNSAEAGRALDALLNTAGYYVETQPEVYETVKYILRRICLRSWGRFCNYIEKLDDGLKSEYSNVECYTHESLAAFAEETLAESLDLCFERGDEIKVINADKKPYKFYPVGTIEVKNEIAEIPKQRSARLTRALAGDPYSLLAYMAEDFNWGVIDARLFPLLRHFAQKTRYDTSKICWMKSEECPELSEAYMLIRYIAYRFGACGKPDRNLARTYLLESCAVVRIMNLDHYYSWFNGWSSILDCDEHDWKTAYLQLLMEEYDGCYTFAEYKEVLSKLAQTHMHVLTSSDGDEREFFMYVAAGTPRLIALLTAHRFNTVDTALNRIRKRSHGGKATELLINALEHAKKVCAAESVSNKLRPLSADEMKYYRSLTANDIAALPADKFAEMERAAANDAYCAFEMGSYYFEKGEENYSNYIAAARYFAFCASEAAYVNRIICFENVALATKNKKWAEKAAALYKEGNSSLCAAKYILSQRVKFDSFADSFDQNVGGVRSRYCADGKSDKNAHLVEVAYNLAHPHEGKEYFWDKKYSLAAVCNQVSEYKDEFDDFEIGMFASYIDEIMNEGAKSEPMRYTYIKMLDAGIGKGSNKCKILKAYFLCSSNSCYMRMKNGEKNGHYSDYDRHEDEKKAYDIIVTLNGKYGARYKKEFDRVLAQYKR